MPDPAPVLPGAASDAALRLAGELKLTVTAASVLASRGITERADGERFLDPKLAHLTKPDSMLDRDAAIERIVRAVERRERIVVFGDYDADGVTSAALMTDVLRTLGADVTTLLANRFEGGYGFSNAAYEKVRAVRPGLLVTCDCGSSDHERIAKAVREGIDVVVIDHHRVPPDPLPALAFLNPHRPECGFPYKGLASVGLALSLAAGIRTRLGVQLDMRKWLDLVAIGTIGDVAPLDGDNRPLVRAGFGTLRTCERPGIRALLASSGTSPELPMTGEDIAFRLAPRINAPGRLGSPDLALRLLLSKSDDEARTIAMELEVLSDRRKEIDRAMFEEALRMLDDPGLAALPVIVLGKQGWHPGVVGIVAGKLASRFRKPTVILALEGAEGRGSARAPNGFHLYDALAASKDTLVSFGGHQAAAGVHIESSKVDAFRDRFAAECTEIGVPDPSLGGVRLDARLHLEDDLGAVVRDFASFEPCGQLNPAPQIALVGAPVALAKEVRGGHLKLELFVGERRISCFGIEMGSRAKSLGRHVHATGALRYDTFRGNGAVEMRLSGLFPA